MKNLKHLLFILLSITSLSSYAQTSKKTLNYQAVILDPNAIDIPGASISGQPLSKGNVCLRFSLLNTAGGVDYEETQQATTDEFGLVSLTIGTGTPSSGTSIYKSFESIVWNANVKSLKVSVSYDGCSSFKQVSTQALNYTPYALYAEAVDYKNVREAPTKLSQFSNDAGYLIPKDLDPIKAEIKSNTSQIQTASQSIADNKLANDAAFLIVNQSLTSLDKQVADNTSSITTMNSRINDQQNQIITNNNTMNAQFGGLQGQLNVTNSTVSNLSGAAEVVSNKSASTTLGGASTSDQLYPTQRATKTYVDQAVAQISSGTISDATTLAAGKIQLAGDLSGTATSPTVPGLAGKENSSNKSLNVQADGTNDTKYPSVKAVKDYVDQATQGTALAADLAAKANTSDVTTSLALKEDVSNKSNGALGTSTTLYPTQSAVKTYVDLQVASATIVDADATTKGKIQLTGDLGGTASSPTVPGLTAKANIASPTFTGTVTSPIYASAPQALTDAATISWNPANGLNANVTLGGNRTLSFSAAPASGSYGTLVVTQDGTGGRTLTLPSGTNKVLGSSSTTTIALSSAANAKDILNFYYDGLTSTYYWNVGQGYGTAATAATVNLATGVTGTLAITNGGTGATTAGAALTALGAQASANLSTDISGDAASLTKYPAVKTVKDYVDATVSSGAPDASTTVKGKIQLAGDLAGSATSPSVVKLRGTALSSVAPVTAGHVLTYDATGSGVAYWAAPANSANTISGVVPVANGGTGLSSVTSGGAVYATSSNALATGTLPLTAGGTGAISQQTAINALTGTQSAGKYLRSDGTNATLSTIQAADVPTLNQNTTGTAANVTGTVGVANGGTGLATLTANNVLLGNGTSALQAVAPGTSGNVLTSNGTTWTSSAPAASGVPYTGATGAVNLGAYSLTVSSFTIGQGKTPANGDNLAIGRSALNNTTANGWPNIGLGSFSLNQTTDGRYNIGLGLNALYANTTGSNNIGIGYDAGRNASTSSNITAVGMEALKNESGSGNTAIGSYAGKVSSGGPYSNTTNSTFIGYNTSTGKTAEQTITNATAIGYGATVTASDKIQLGNTSVTNVATSGTITAGDVTYPKTHGTANQVLTTTGSGTLTFASPAVAKPISDQFTATAAQISFTLSQTPITNTTVSPNVKPNVWMFINGIRTNNLAYTISGTTVTYAPANNNSYAIVVGDRIQFDYAY